MAKKQRKGKEEDDTCSVARKYEFDRRIAYMTVFLVLSVALFWWGFYTLNTGSHMSTDLHNETFVQAHTKAYLIETGQDNVFNVIGGMGIILVGVFGFGVGFAYNFNRLDDEDYNG